MAYSIISNAVVRCLIRAMGVVLTMALACFVVSQSGSAQELSDAMFLHPPAEYKPKTWVHAMSGNMSKAGITKDFEAIAKVGIGGVLLFNVTHTIPNGTVRFNSPEHLEILKHAAQECERLHLSFGVHNCDGWTSSGGPWVTPENAMKMLVQSETIIDGGKNKSIKLPQPTTRKGYYKDVVVLAYPATPLEIEDFDNKPKVTSSDPEFNAVLATDGRLDEETTLKGTVHEEAWVQFDYQKSFTVSRVEMALEKTITGNGGAILWKSDDGINFTKVQTLKILRMAKREFGFEDIVEPVTAKSFRVSVNGVFDLMEIRLKADAGIADLMGRKSMFKKQDASFQSIGNPSEAEVIPTGKIRNLSSSLMEDGTLKIDLPEGKWTVLRFGYTTTGYVNGPASKEGGGLEIDKMSKQALKIHFDAYVGKVIEKVRAVAPNALQYMEIDSYEVGGQNWTTDYEDIFEKEFKYDLIAFLPVYAGKFVESKAATEAVLDDVRYLNSKLITQNYFGYFTALCHDNGLISYIEPYSINGPFNELDAAKFADIPMGEFWLHQRYVTNTAVSGARIYGKNVVSAESFSAQSDINWKANPSSLKATGDKAWTLGINEFMFHRYAHQANTNVLPGMTMSMFGTHMDRTQTWWYNAGEAWFTYLARGQYMLRQGNPVSDLLVFVGDGTPNSSFDRNQLRGTVPGYLNYDCINADALVSRISEKLSLPNGISYKALMLTNTKKIRLGTVEKLAELSRNGVIIIGDKPEVLIGYKHSDEQVVKFNALVNQIWSSSNTYSGSNVASVFTRNNIAPDLIFDSPATSNYIHRRTNAADIYFFHNADSVSNLFNCSFNVSGKVPEIWDAKTGRTVSLASYYVEKGRTNISLDVDPNASIFVVFKTAAEGVKSLKLVTTTAAQKPVFFLSAEQQIQAQVHENGNYKVQFDNGKQAAFAVAELPQPITLKNNWEVNFKDEIDKPFNTSFDTLIDWKDAKENAIKYFAGTASYKNTCTLGRELVADNIKLTLDLGKVSVAARVIVNDIDLGVLWSHPYHIDMSKAVKVGNNKIEIQVTNVWTNKLIGDERFPRTDDYSVNNPKMPVWYSNNEPMPAGKRVTFTTYEFYRKDDPLISSGLIGPVRIIFSKIIRNID